MEKNKEKIKEMILYLRSKENAIEPSKQENLFSDVRTQFECGFWYDYSSISENIDFYL